MSDTVVDAVANRLPPQPCDPIQLARELVAIVHEHDEPQFWHATTRQLLEEIATRMRVTQNSEKGRELGKLCAEAILMLDPGVLNYRMSEA